MHGDEQILGATTACFSMETLSRAKRRVAARLAWEVWPPEYSGEALIPLGTDRGVESTVLGRTGARLRLGIGEFDHSQGL